MLGYTRDPRLSKIKTSIEDASLNLEQPFRESSYITLFITIEPQLLVPEMFRESYDSIENIQLLDKVVEWTLAFSRKFPTREFRPTVMNTEGKSVIMTRYFKPLKPPEELVDAENTDKTIVRLFCYYLL
jgi:coiled-coil and C2 domain-containing protein 2A